MTTWAEISNSINDLHRGELLAAQRRQVRQQTDEAQAVKKEYDQMARRMAESGGNLDSVAAMVRSGPGLQAFAQFTKDYAQSEKGMAEAHNAMNARLLQGLKVFTGYGQKALDQNAPMEERVASMQYASAVAPFSMKLGAFHADTNEFDVEDMPDAISGFRPTGGRVPLAEVEETLRRTLAGNIVGPGGELLNKQYMMAAMLADEDRKRTNMSILANPEQHFLLEKGGRTLTVVPQQPESFAVGGTFLIVDPDKGLTPVRDLDAYVRDGWRVTTQKQMNKDAELGMDRQRLGLTAMGHNLAAQRFAFDVSRDQREMAGAYPLKDQMTVANTMVDNLRQRQNDILRAYAEFPDVSGMDPMAAVTLLNRAKTMAVQNLERAAQSGDPRAKRDMAEYERNERDYSGLMNRGAELAFGMAGVARPEDPVKAARAEVPRPTPGETLGVPAYGKTGSSMRGVVRGGGAAGDMERGAFQAADGQWYVQRDGKWHKVVR